MAESRTAIMAALLGNGSLAVLKGVAAASTGSAAMLAETLHSIADTGNQALLSGATIEIRPCRPWSSRTRPRLSHS
jgi:divalent metal cation (Fe/Co/Zn/Cd) transporter